METLAADVAKGKALTSTRLTFAKQLHYSENYAESLEIISRVLAEHPDNLEALTLEADIYQHQEKYDEAQALAEKVISSDETYVDAWKVLIYVHQARQDWENLLVAATQALELQVGSQGWALLLTQRAIARLELGNFEGVEADIERLLQGGGRYCLRQASKLQKEMRSRLRQSEEAYETNNS